MRFTSRDCRRSLRFLLVLRGSLLLTAQRRAANLLSIEFGQISHESPITSELYPRSAIGICTVEYETGPVARHLSVRAIRLREETETMLLSWQHSGFHVHAGEPVLPGDTDRLEHLARYITRAPIRLDAITPLDAACVVVRTPPDPQTGSQPLGLDVLEMIRRLCAQIPAPRQHLVRYYGWYSHRARGVRGEGATTETSSSPSTPRSRSWARLLRKIFEVEPLLCPQCNVEMRLVSVIRTPTVIDGILGHLQRIGGKDPHEGTAQRGPPVG